VTAGFAAEPAHDVELWKDHVDLAKEKGLKMVQVNIHCSLGENEKRVVSEERVKLRKAADAGKAGGKFKNIRPERLAELRDAYTMIDARKIEYGKEVKFWQFDNSVLRVKESVRILRGVLVHRSPWVEDVEDDGTI